MAVGSEDRGAGRGEPCHHLAARVPEAIPTADAHESETRGDFLQECRRRRGPASVVRDLQDIGRKVGASSEKVSLRGRLDVPRQQDLPGVAETKKEDQRSVVLGRAGVVPRAGMKDLEGDAGRYEPVSGLEDLDGNLTARGRFQRLVQEQVPRRSPRQVDAIDGQELQGGEEPSGMVGVGMGQDDGVERTAPSAARRGRRRVRPKS